jgi:hypothetical protein
VKYCGNCFGMRLDGLKTIQKPSKYQEAVAVKIAAKEEQIKQISQVGPVLAMIVGALCGLAIFGIPFGILMILFGIVWAVKRGNDRKNLQAEIKELQYERG